MDITELKRLAEAATPQVGHACNYMAQHWVREGHVDFETADLFIATERPQEDSEYYAAVHPACVLELIAEVERLRAERDEADRRAGAAEREKESLAEACHARQSWLDKAKDQWGVDRNVSFDVVWAEALALKVAQSKGE